LRALRTESEALFRSNRRIVELGGNPIPRAAEADRKGATRARPKPARDYCCRNGRFQAIRKCPIRRSRHLLQSGSKRRRVLRAVAALSAFLYTRCIASTPHEDARYAAGTAFADARIDLAIS